MASPKIVRPELDVAPMRPIAVNSSAALEAAVPGCRMVSTFKYRFDGFFALSEEGVVNGTTSVLLFRVVGRKDIHLQLSSTIPPSADDTYEASQAPNNKGNKKRLWSQNLNP